MGSFPKPIRETNKRILDEVRQDYCFICRRPPPSDPDHILSRGAGGGDTRNNLWPLCRLCHAKRHAKGLVWMAVFYPHALQELRRRGFEEIAQAAENELKKEVMI